MLCQQTRHGGDLTHLDRVTVETSQYSVEPGQVTPFNELPPAIEVPFVGVAGNAFPEPLQVVFDGWPPLIEALAVEPRREATVKLPRPALGSGQLRHDWAPHDFQAETHARQQSVELLVAEVDLAGEELADARLTHPAEP